MLPDSIPHYSVGPFFGLSAHAVLMILCLVMLILFRSYRPLRSLFFFYLFSTFFFLGWFIYGLQRSPGSILLGYRIDLAALAMLPTSWAWFDSALSKDRPGWLPRAMTGMSGVLAGFALFGQGSWFLGFPLIPHEITPDILRPQSILLRPLIHAFGLSICLIYFGLTIRSLWQPKPRRPFYLLPFGVGMVFWFLGGLHDALRSAGFGVPFKGQILWFTSIWLSISLTITVASHFLSLEQAVREARDVFEKFVPPSYLRRIAARGLGSIRLGEADQAWGTILFCDIRGFTALSERISPSQLVAIVNLLFERITWLVDRRQGVIDKFLGDSVLCIFEGPDSAERAVACGVDMLGAVHSLDRGLPSPTDQVLRIGIGLHTGPVILGTIGSEERMDSTVLGLTVNLAKRLEEITKPLGVDMLISEQVADRLPENHSHRLRSLGEVSLRGSSTPMALLEVYDRDPVERQKLKNQTHLLMAEGFELFKTGSLEMALLKFNEAHSILPEDRALHLIITSINQYLDQGGTFKGTALIDLS